jgi:KAP family P-loop domain
MTAPSFGEEVVIVRLSSRQSDMPVKEVPSTHALAQLLARATLINSEARQRGYERSGFDISFKSMLLAFLISDDPWSRWFKPYVQAKTASVDELLKERHFQGGKEFEELDSHANRSDAELEMAVVRRQTADGELLVDAARELCTETPPQDADRPLDVRHLIGAYIYRPPDRPGSSDSQKLASWGYDRGEWSNYFLAKIKDDYPAELDSWAGIHREVFGSYPDILKVEAVPIHPDAPAKVDELGRMGFAITLAKRIRHMRSEDKESSFILHLHGPWGSGKSSLLNFLGQQLRGEDSDPTEVTGEDPDLTERTIEPWVVIEFNAWQYQRVGPPWWWLIKALFQQGFQQLWTIQWRKSKERSFLGNLRALFREKRRISLALRDWWRAIMLMLREYLWRFFETGWTLFLLALFLVSLVIWFISRGFSSYQIATGLFNNVEKYSAILSIIIVGSGFIFGIIRSLLPGSAAAARTFLETTRNPTQALTRHFNSLVKRLRYPVAIFIDDLDRCQHPYVIDLLEGIQTMFREAPVAYVVAADDRWIRACYEQVYDTFASRVNEPERSLGSLFLEKTFQLSLVVPHMLPEDRERYWDRLIETAQSRDDEPNKERRLEDELRKAQRRYRPHKSATPIMEELRESPDTDDPIIEQAHRIAAAIQLGTPEVEASTEHALRPFAPLLEPNPRSMKRLLNAFTIRRSVDVLAGRSIDRDKLTLCTILALRWPLFMEYLVEHPEKVEYIEDVDMLDRLHPQIPEDLRALFQDEEVQAVFKFRGKLDAKAIRAWGGRPTRNSSNETLP